MAIVLAQAWQQANYSNGGSSNTTSISYTGVTAGNALVAVNIGAAAPDAGYANNAFSVNDGTAYTNLLERGTNPSGNNWYVCAGHVLLNAAGGTHNVVGTNAAGTFSSYGTLLVGEFSGVVTANALDTSNVGVGNTTTPDSNSTGTLAQQPELVIACFSSTFSSAPTPTEPSGFTNVALPFNAAWGSGSLDYRIVTTTAAQDANWGSSFGGATPVWVAIIFALKGVTSGGGGGAGGSMGLMGVGK